MILNEKITMDPSMIIMDAEHGASSISQTAHENKLLLDAKKEGFPVEVCRNYDSTVEVFEIVFG